MEMEVEYPILQTNLSYSEDTQHVQETLGPRFFSESSMLTSFSAKVFLISSVGCSFSSLTEVLLTARPGSSHKNVLC